MLRAALLEKIRDEDEDLWERPKACSTEAWPYFVQANAIEVPTPRLPRLPQRRQQSPPLQRPGSAGGPRPQDGEASLAGEEGGGAADRGAVEATRPGLVEVHVPTAAYSAATPAAAAGGRTGLSWRMEEALVGLFHAAAAAETAAEQRRAALARQPGFRPMDGFRGLVLASTQDPGRVRLPLGDLRRWLEGSWASVSPSDHELARALLGCEDLPEDGGFLGFADFLRLVLPRDPLHEAERLQGSLPPEEDATGGACAGLTFGGAVEYALRRMIEEEVDFIRRTCRLRRELAAELRPAQVHELLWGEAGRATAESVADYVTDTLGALDHAQAATLFRRLSAFDEEGGVLAGVRVLMAPMSGDDLVPYRQ